VTNGSEDLEAIAARHRRRVEQPTHVCPDTAEVSADLDFLITQLHEARARIDELTQNDEDLRASAEIWCRLYEAAAARASGAEAGPREIPANLRILAEALTRVGDLTEAVGRTIRECASCVRKESPGTAEAVAAQLCARCALALGALDPRRA
jgi:hypothetical protein